MLGNRITKNRTGIVTQANARPLLRGNVIEGNKEDGVVVIATSQPNLGTRQNRAAMSFVRMVAMTLTAVLLAVIPAFGNTSPMLVSVAA